MNEWDLIRSLARRAGTGGAGILTGIGDDGAVTAVPAGFELVTVLDTLVAGTHFPADLEPRAIGHRALAVNLSDLAAMGAEPRWCLLGLSLQQPSASWLEAFADGLCDLAEGFGLRLIGGDTVRGPLVITVTALGLVPAGRAILRSGAMPGDQIYVTGWPGEAGFAWRAALGGESLKNADPLQQRFAYPSPRVNEGIALRGIASAMIDLSDGLIDDLGHLLDSSVCGAELDADAVPLSSALLERAGAELALELALNGGDDYELCFTVPAGRESALTRAIAGFGCPVRRIGTVVEGSSMAWRRHGQLWDPPRTGFAHF